MLELISIHIPKTAGTSFEQTLKGVYGDSAVLRINNINRFIKTKKYNAFKQKNVPQHIKVIHGHFKYVHLKSYINIPENIPVITWVRDPVERSISNFNYRKRVLHEDLEKANVGEKTYRKHRTIEKSIIEYASKKGQRNRMASFLKGVSLEQLLFVGIAEHYSEDLADLAQLLQWGNFKEYRVNVSKKEYVNAKKRKVIKSYNYLDYKLYYQSVYLRKKRVGTISASDKIRYFSHRTIYFIMRGLKNKIIYFAKSMLKR